MTIVVPFPVPAPALPLPDPADLSTWPARMKELHRWMREDAAVFISALGDASYQNALHAIAMADSAAGSANFKGAWSALTGALNMPASTSHSGKIWLLTANLANVTTATPGVSGSWLDITNFLMGVSTASAARTALDVYSKSESLALAPAKNLIDNSNFSVNQRGVSGTVTLAAGAYGHDRWKGGSSGCTYTFAASAGINTVTVSAGSLVHVVDGANLETGSYRLSHGGTAQVRVVGGSYAAGPITVSATAGTNLSLEFGTGTIKQVKLEKGTTATPWVMPGIEDYLACLRRAYVFDSNTVSDAVIALGDIDSGGVAKIYFDMPLPMPSIPSFTNLSALGNYRLAYGDGSQGPAPTAMTAVSATRKTAVISMTAPGLVAGNFTRLLALGTASCRILFSCDL